MPAGGCRGLGRGARAAAVRADAARAPGASRAGDGARQPHVGRGRGPRAGAGRGGGGLGGTAPDAARGAARPGAAGAAALAVRAARAAADRRVPAGALCRDRPAPARAVAAEGRPGPRRGCRTPRSLGGPCLGRPRPGDAARACGGGGGRVRGPAGSGRLLQHRRPRARRQPGADRRAQRAVRPPAAPLPLVSHSGPHRRPHRARDGGRGVPAGRGGHGVPAAARERAHVRRHGGGDALAQRTVGAVGVRDGAAVFAEHGAPQPADPRQRAAAAPAAGGDGRDRGRVDRSGEGDPRIVVGGDVRAGLHQAEPQESRDGRGGHAAGSRARAHGGPTHRRRHGACALERCALRAARRDDAGRPGRLPRLLAHRLSAGDGLRPVHRPARPCVGGRPACQRSRVHHGAAAGLRHRRWRARRDPVQRPAPADRYCPRRDSARTAPDPGRAHHGLGRRKRTGRPRSAGAPDGGADHVPHHPRPAVDHSREPDPVPRSRPRAGARHARRAAASGGVVCQLVPPPDDRCGPRALRRCQRVMRLPRGTGERGGTLAVAMLLAFALPRAAAPQVGTTTDIITGKVTGRDSQPLAGALVQATSLETQVSRQRTTDARGRFTIVFPEGGGQYQLTVRYVGMAPARATIARQADEDRLVANVRMDLAIVALEPVTVQAAAQLRGLERLGPGATGRELRSEAVSRLPIAPSDLTALATLAPGVVGIAETDSTRPAFSVAGQRPTANRITLDGLSFGGAMVPQDAIRATRVVTNTYDVARGQFSGGLVASTTRSGTNVPQGAFTYNGRDRALAWGGVTVSPFSQGYTQNQIGGGMGGPIVRDRLFAFGALQVRSKDQALPSLATADPATLARLGGSPDSAARFLALEGATGVPVSVPDARGDRGINNAAALHRMDWNVAEAHTLMLRLDGRWNSDDPTRVRSLALPSTGGRRWERAGGVMASLTSHFGEQLINEVRGYVSAEHTDAGGFLAVPEARVHVTSDLPDSIRGIATLTFGGNHGFPQHTDNTTAEVREEVSWLTHDAAHRIKLGGYFNSVRLRANETPNQLGTFVFHSLDALAAGRPSSFSRTLAPLYQAGTAWNEALDLGHTWP